MKSKLVSNTAGERRFVIVMDPGDEAMAKLGEFARAQGLTGASLSAIGGFSSAKVGWFDADNKEYRPIPVDEQCEVLSLQGDVALDEKGGTAVHVHAVLGLRSGEARGGHLISGTVRPTLEVVLVETPAELRRTNRPQFGIALIDLGSSSAPAERRS